MCEVTVTLNPVISISVSLAEAEYLQALLQNALKKAIYPLKSTELR